MISALPDVALKALFLSQRVCLFIERRRPGRTNGVEPSTQYFHFGSRIALHAQLLSKHAVDAEKMVRTVTLIQVLDLLGPRTKNSPGGRTD